MIAMRYTKTDGAEFISHLDLLRHIYRTLRRAGIPVNYSGGFHKHPRIFLNNPLGTGIKSVAEYATIDTPFTGDFKERFNLFSPDGIKCADCAYVESNQNYANCITSCTYTAEGLAPFDPEEIMREKAIPLIDSRGRQIDIRPRIYAVEWQGDALKFTAGCGENNLRPDLFCAYLEERFGGSAKNITKVAAGAEGVKFI